MKPSVSAPSTANSGAKPSHDPALSKTLFMTASERRPPARRSFLNPFESPVPTIALKPLPPSKRIKRIAVCGSGPGPDNEVPSGDDPSGDDVLGIRDRVWLVVDVVSDSEKLVAGLRIARQLLVFVNNGPSAEGRR